MGDDHQRSTDVPRDALHIVLVVVDAGCDQHLVAGAAAMAAQAHGVRCITLRCEIRQEMLAPAPCSDERAVDKEQLRRLRRRRRHVADDFEAADVHGLLHVS
jgi:hypothetical protein